MEELIDCKEKKQKYYIFINPYNFIKTLQIIVLFIKHIIS